MVSLGHNELIGHPSNVFSQEVMDLIESSEPDLGEMQKTGQGVLVKLPPSEAKVNVQKQLLETQDKFEE